LHAALLALGAPHDVLLTTDAFDPGTGITGRVDVEDCLYGLDDRHCGSRLEKVEEVLDVCGGNQDRLLFMEECVLSDGRPKARLYILFRLIRLS
jgi:hypothetical protein